MCVCRHSVFLCSPQQGLPVDVMDQAHLVQIIVLDWTADVMDKSMRKAERQRKCNVGLTSLFLFTILFLSSADGRSWKWRKCHIGAWIPSRLPPLVGRWRDHEPLNRCLRGRSFCKATARAQSLPSQLRIGKNSNIGKLAGAITNAVQRHGQVEVRAIGAESVNNLLKSICIATTFTQRAAAAADIALAAAVSRQSANMEDGRVVFAYVFTLRQVSAVPTS